MYYKISIPRWQIYCFSLLLTPSNSYTWIAAVYTCSLFYYIYIVTTTPLLSVYANWGVSLKMYNFSLIWDCFKTKRDWTCLLCRTFPNLHTRTTHSRTQQQKKKQGKGEEHQVIQNTIGKHKQTSCAAHRSDIWWKLKCSTSIHPEKGESHDGRVCLCVATATWAEVEVLCWLVCLLYFLELLEVGIWKQASFRILYSVLHCMLKLTAACGLLEKVSLDELWGIFITYHITMSNTKVYRFSRFF